MNSVGACLIGGLLIGSLLQSFAGAVNAQSRPVPLAGSDKQRSRHPDSHRAHLRHALAGASELADRRGPPVPAAAYVRAPERADQRFGRKQKIHSGSRAQVRNRKPGSVPANTRLRHAAKARKPASRNWQSDAGRNAGQPSVALQTMPPVRQPDAGTSRMQSLPASSRQETVVRRLALGGYHARVFSYAELATLNPCRREIFDIVWINVQRLLWANEQQISKLSLRELTDQIRYGFGFANVNHEVSRKMRDLMVAISGKLDSYAVTKEQIGFYSYTDSERIDSSVVAVHSGGKIYFNDRFFEKNPVWQMFIFIHELAHAVGAKDRFYFSSNIVTASYANGQLIRQELLDFPIARAFLVFINSVCAQVAQVADDPSESLYNNADTLALYALYLFNATAARASLLESNHLIRSRANQRRFPSLQQG